MEFSLRHHDRFVVPANDLLAANPDANVALRNALVAWEGTEVLVYPSREPGDAVEIFGDRPLAGGQYVISVTELNIPPTATHPLNWQTIVPVGVGVTLLGWWAYRKYGRRGDLMALDLPQVAPGKCCPPGARVTRNNRCHDGKKFVSFAPCVTTRGTRRVGREGWRARPRYAREIVVGSYTFPARLARKAKKAGKCCPPGAFPIATGPDGAKRSAMRCQQRQGPKAGRFVAAVPC